MTVSMVAPKLSRFDLWVHPISESDDDGDVLGFLALLAQPLQATTNGTPLPDVISVSYGVCESTVSAYTASRTVVERQLAATAALGITTVVAAGDTGSSACARGVPASKLTSSDKKAQVSWPATLAVGARRRRHEPHAQRRQHDRLHRRLERHRLPGAVHQDGGRRRRPEHVQQAPVVAARAVVHELDLPHGPRRRGLRRRQPGLPDRLLAAASRAAPARARASPSSAARAPPRRSSPA